MLSKTQSKLHCIPKQVLKKLKFSGLTWTHDNKGIFYSAYQGAGEGEKTAAGSGDEASGKDPTGLKHHRLYYHVVGTEQAEDILVAEFPDEPQWLL